MEPPDPLVQPSHRHAHLHGRRERVSLGDELLPERQHPRDVAGRVRVDGRRVEEAVNRMTPRRTAKLAPMISRFCRERILWDYLEDAKLLVRLNQVMRRVGLDQLPERLREVLPTARHLVASRQGELLEGIPVDGGSWMEQD